MARHRRSSLYGRGIVNFADSYSLRSHIPLRSCLVGLRLWSDNVNWNSCICTIHFSCKVWKNFGWHHESLRHSLTCYLRVFKSLSVWCSIPVKINFAKQHSTLSHNFQLHSTTFNCNKYNIQLQLITFIFNAWNIQLYHITFNGFTCQQSRHSKTAFFEQPFRKMFNSCCKIFHLGGRTKYIYLEETEH